MKKEARSFGITNLTHLLVMIFLIFFSLSTQADFAPYTFDSNKDVKRFANLTKEVRCVVCQNQSLADSNAPLANDLRQKIYTLINEEKTDTEIKAYLVKRYGEFILLKPSINKITLMLWSFPFIALIFVFIFLFWLVKVRG